MWKYIAGSVAFGSLTYCLMRYCTGGYCKCTTRLDDLVIVITGANSGIGKALATELAKRGATLVLACRDIKQGIEAKKGIVSSPNTQNSRIFVKELDLTSINSILKFADSLKSEFEEIYALVNNAGVFYYPQELTQDGFDVTFQTNYLGPFILTHTLLSLLKKSEHARIINVASESHRLVDSEDLNSLAVSQTGIRSHFTAYGASKLALILFTRVLFKKLIRSNVIVNAADPGNVETNIYRHFPALSNPFFFALQYPIRLVVIKSPRQGAQTILHSLLTSNRSSGQYYSDCKLTLPSPLASDDTLAKEFYELTLRILDNKFSTESYC